MSENVTIAIDLKDENCLVESLKELGFVVEQNKVAKKVKGYYRSDKVAQVILRKTSNRGFSADVGFELLDDKYFVHYDSMDKRKLKLKLLKQLYAKIELKQLLCF